MAPAALSIAIVTVANLPQGGGRTGRLRTLAAALVGLGHRVTIWNEHALEPGGIQQVSGELCGARYEYVLGTTDRRWGFQATALKLRAVARILQKVKSAAAAGDLDLVLSNNLAFYDTYPITRFARRLGVPTIQCYEDERRELVGNVGFAQRVFGLNAWMADHYCSRLADQIWVISSYLQKKYARLSGHPERVRVIPTIVDCEAWSLPPEPNNPVPVLLYAGSFSEQDDTDKLIHALAMLKNQGVNFRMRFLGADSDNEQVALLKAKANQLGIRDSVDLVGFCSAEVVKREIAGASILVNLRTDSLWSRSGLSTKLSEYLAASRTVLTTDIGDNARYVQHGTSALVVSPQAPAGTVAELLQQAIERPEWRQLLAAGARKAALTHFDIPVVQRNMTDALAQIRRLQNTRHR